MYTVADLLFHAQQMTTDNQTTSIGMEDLFS